MIAKDFIRRARSHGDGLSARLAVSFSLVRLPAAEPYFMIAGTFGHYTAVTARDHEAGRRTRVERAPELAALASVGDGDGYFRARTRGISLSMSEDSAGLGEETFSSWLSTM